jgi:uncharacterized protein (DUF427 family)
VAHLPPGVVPVPPGPGQESVWDYPRPPRVQASSKRVVVTLGGLVIVDTTTALRVLETSHPPSWYLPFTDVVPGVMVPASGSSYCEWKGVARYVDLVAGGVRAERAGWFYPEPALGLLGLREHLALYPALMDRCTVGADVVIAQTGGFYGGWITADVVGPFKGAPGTGGW